MIGQGTLTIMLIHYYEDIFLRFYIFVSFHFVNYVNKF